MQPHSLHKKSQPLEFSAGKPLVFLHMPRCAGTAFCRGIVQALKPQKYYYGIDWHEICDRKTYNLFSDDIKRTVFIDCEDMPLDADLVAGHISYNFLRQRYPLGTFITFLREPITRVISHWLQIRSASSDIAELGKISEFEQRCRGPLRNILIEMDDKGIMDNLMLRLLVIDHPKAHPFKAIKTEDDNELFELALKNFSDFDYIDFHENPNLHVNFGEWLGRPFNWPYENQLPDIPDKLKSSLYDELNDETLALLHQRTRLDLKLWEYIVLQRGFDPAVLRTKIITHNVMRYSQRMG